MIAEVPSCSGRLTVMSTSAWPLSVSLTSSTLPDRGAADQDLVALDQLPAGLEEQPVVVSVPPLESRRTMIAMAIRTRAPSAAGAGEAARPLVRARPAARQHPRQGSRPPCLGRGRGREPRASVRVPMTVPSSSSSSPASSSLLSCRILQLRSDPIRTRTRVGNWP